MTKPIRTFMTALSGGCVFIGVSMFCEPKAEALHFWCVPPTVGEEHACWDYGEGYMCWGDNTFGQLGNGTTVSATIPTVVDKGTDFATAGPYWAILSAGGNHTCGIKDDYTLWCWGENSSGELGNGSNSPAYSSTPVQVPGTSWLSVYAGVSHTCALTTAGSLWCWGDNSAGELGTGNTTSNALVNWSPAQVGTATDWTEISAGGDFTCGIEDNGSTRSLWCWGANTDGQVGKGNTTAYSTPTQIGTGSQWDYVTTGLSHACATKETTYGVPEGTLWCWGSNSFGQLGTGNTTSNSLINWSPSQVGSASDWGVVSAGYEHTCAQQGTSLYCWGGNTFGQLGNGTTTNSSTPPASPLSLVLQGGDLVVAGGFETCVQTNLGFGLCSLDCWGDNYDGQLGENNSITQKSPEQVWYWNQVSVGDGFASPNSGTACGITTEGTLWCWGEGEYGTLGNGVMPPTESEVPSQESSHSTNWREVSIGEGTACATKFDGTLWCWGVNNATGNLGVGSTTINFSDTPLQEHTYATNWVSVSVGGDTPCATRSDGTLWCWGYGAWGQRGDGSTTNAEATPVQEASRATNWQTVSGGDYFNTCAIKNDGSLFCWGNNDYGALGNGSTASTSIPTQEHTYANDWSTVASGQASTCAIKTNGTLWCWGLGSNGQLGNGTSTATNDLPTIQEDTYSTDWSSVSTGGDVTCATKTDGSLWCWGLNQWGQVGSGSTTGFTLSPIQVTSGVAAKNSWFNVSVGFESVCASQGPVYCWGMNLAGIFGNGTYSGTPTTTPVAMSPISQE